MAHHGQPPRFGASPGVEESLPGDLRGAGATLIGARVTGVRVTPISGATLDGDGDERGYGLRYTGPGSSRSAVEGGGGGGGGMGGAT